MTDNQRYYFGVFMIVQCMCINLVHAHPGGHNTINTTLNRWNLVNGKTTIGNFSFGNNETIFLEQEDGKIIGIPLVNLTIQDQKLARFFINRIQHINDAPIKSYKNPLNIKLPGLISLISCFFVLVFFYVLLLKIKKYQNSLMPTFRMDILLLMVAGCFSINASNITQSIIPKTSIAFLDAAFLPYTPAIATRNDDNYYYVASNGIPAHNMMVGISRWQQQVPTPKKYSGSNAWSIPLQPEFAEIPLSTKNNLMKGAVAIAVNGVPIFNALNNRGEDAYLIGELDQWGGHCGRADDYHYHTAPLHLSETSGLLPIAFGLDGFPVYGTLEPDGSSMAILDSCNGHNGKNGLYHYHGTSTYPYLIGAIRGKVTLDPDKTAPENQIIPQAFTKPIRPATSPLRNAVITGFQSMGTNGYLLTYKIGQSTGYVQYNWDESNQYNFKLTDVFGQSSITTYKR